MSVCLVENRTRGEKERERVLRYFKKFAYLKNFSLFYPSILEKNAPFVLITKIKRPISSNYSNLKNSSTLQKNQSAMLIIHYQYEYNVHEVSISMRALKITNFTNQIVITIFLLKKKTKKKLFTSEPKRQNRRVISSRAV